MSPRRAATEIAVVLGVLVGGTALIVWGAGALATRLVRFVPPSVDRTLGQQVSTMMRASSPVCESNEPVQYVRSIAQPLIEALGPVPYEFDFVVVDDPTVNAFALPGGFVTVNMGLLNSAQTGAEVAAVLAHELQHVLGRHGTTRILRQVGGTTMLSALFGGTDIAVPAAAMGDLLHTAYDRDQEREADQLGQRLMVQAGLNPEAMARFFERLAQQGGTPPEILSTHPDPGGRAASARAAGQGVTATRSLPPPGDLACDPR